VLLRALEPIAGSERMLRNRKLQIPRFARNDNPTKVEEKTVRLLCSGPARLCQALGIDRLRDNGKDLLSRDSDLQLLEDGFRVGKVVSTTRIGITKSADLPLRFYIEGSPFVSKK
jgi:DNA-3-methyladenine glycosylase